VVAYLLSAVVAREFLSPESTPALLRLSALAIAFVLIVAAYTVLSFWVGPRIDESVVLEVEDRKAAMARSFAARKAVKDSRARAARWWHHTIAGVGGFAYGFFLARALNWLLA
jgi:hypothetical protein